MRSVATLRAMAEAAISDSWEFPNNPSVSAGANFAREILAMLPVVEAAETLDRANEASRKRKRSEPCTPFIDAITLAELDLEEATRAWREHMEKQ